MRRHPSPTAKRSIEVIRKLIVSGEVIMTTRLNAAELYVGAELSADSLGEAAKIDRMLASVGMLEFDDTARGLTPRSKRSSGGPDRLWVIWMP